MTACGYCFTFVEYCGKIWNVVLEIRVSQSSRSSGKGSTLEIKRGKLRKKEKGKKLCPSGESNRTMHAREVQNYATYTAPREITRSRLAEIFYFKDFTPFYL